MDMALTQWVSQLLYKPLNLPLLINIPGIVGMEDPKDQGYGLIGIAPEATLAAYRIFSCQGTTTTDIIMAALQRAVTDGADVISYSLGSTDYWEALDPFVTIAANIRKKGVAWIAAAGNDGLIDTFDIGDPSSGRNILAVASVENEVIPLAYKMHDASGNTIHYLAQFPHSSPHNYSVLHLGEGLGIPINASVASGCWPGSWDAIDAAHQDWNLTFALLAKTDNCFDEFWTLPPNIEVPNIIYYNPTASTLSNLEPPENTVTTDLYMTYDDAQNLIKRIEATPKGKKYQVSFSDHLPTNIKSPLGRTVSPFSSIGPTIELDPKPDVAAPGGNILSTWPLDDGAYIMVSGSSMACPYTAGVYALLKSQYPSYSVDQLFRLLKSTAAPLAGYGTSQLTTMAQQGAGLINAKRALEADALISPSSITFKDSDKPASQKITITNRSNQKQAYQISHLPGEYFKTYTWGKGLSHVFGPGNYQLGLSKPASFSSSQSSITIDAGKSGTVDVTITPQHETDLYTAPVYSGYIVITSAAGKIHSLPYLGMPFSRNAVPAIVTDQQKALGVQTPIIMVEDQFNAMHPGKPDFQEFSFSGTTWPGIVVVSTIPTRFWRVDLVPANTEFKPTIYGFNTSKTFPYQKSKLPLDKGPVLEVPTYGWIGQAGFGDLPVNPVTLGEFIPMPYVNSSVIIGGLANGTGDYLTLKAGDYRPLLRILKSGGNATRSADYTSWLGPIWRITDS